MSVEICPMRRILIKIVAILTRQDRYVPTVEWSSSFVYNIFRCIELIFGRKAGIQREALAKLGKNEDGSWFIHREFFTLEARLCHYEGALKHFFSYNIDFLIRSFTERAVFKYLSFDA